MYTIPSQEGKVYLARTFVGPFPRRKSRYICQRKHSLPTRLLLGETIYECRSLLIKKGTQFSPEKQKTPACKFLFFFFEIMHTCEATACMPSGISLCFLQVTFVIRFAMYVCAISGGNFESPEIALSPCSIVM